MSPVALEIIQPSEVRDQRTEFATEDGVAEEGFAQFEVVIHHFLAVLVVGDHASDLLQHIAILISIDIWIAENIFQ